MSTYEKPPHPVTPEEALLLRIQQENQRQVLGKLLHDLRNPVHSIRITVELFGRLARRGGDMDKLVERAAAYIEPAEAALDNLLANSDRLGRYLAAPAAARIAAIEAGELLSEIALLLRAARHRLQVTCAPCETGAAVTLSADRARLGHVLLHCCLSNAAASVTLSVLPQSAELARVEVQFEAGQPAVARSEERSAPLSTEELRMLVESAGGTLAAADGSRISLTFSRWLAPLHPE